MAATSGPVLLLMRLGTYMLTPTGGMRPVLSFALGFATLVLLLHATLSGVCRRVYYL